MMSDHNNPLKLMLVAGEASGDALGATLAEALGKSLPAGTKTELFGGTGKKMRSAGVESIVRTDDLAIIGLLEEACALHKFWRAYQTLKRAAIERQPTAVILIDWPDFNMHLARALHAAGMKIIYYVSPQLWAWRSYRIRNIRRDVDLVLSILPFEPDWYRAHGIEHVEFVGHPLTDTCSPRFSKYEFCAQNSLDEERPIIVLMPGSRRKEIDYILPPMLEAAAIIRLRQPEVQFVIPLAPMRQRSDIENVIERERYKRAVDGLNRHSIKIVEHQTYEALAAADAAAVASGTATLEAGLIGTPLVVVYKVSAINWHTLGRLINVRHYGLINLIAGEAVATELLQNNLTGERLAQEIDKLLQPEKNSELRVKLDRATAVLRGKDAANQAARAVLRAVSSRAL